MHFISNILLKHANHIKSDPWAGLPELTNSSEPFAGCYELGWVTDEQMGVTAMIHVGLKRGLLRRSWTCWRRCTVRPGESCWRASR